VDAKRGPVALIVLDGWALNPNPEGNAVALARKPNFDRYWAEYPHTTLTTFGEAVGLIPGQMGDSNVGHLNLGAGRVVFQTLGRIHKAIKDGEFFRNEVFLGAMQRVKERGGALHLMGLVSDGGVHSHIDHLLALIDMAKDQGINQLYVHAFTDGRDVSPTSAPGFIAQVEEKLAQVGIGRIATVMGRYYSMDRDKRWERTEKALLAIMNAEGLVAPTAQDAIKAAYDRGETDEFILPTVIAGPGKPPVTLGRDDAAIFFNFRPDRARQLSRAMWETAFDGFARPAGFHCVDLVSMTQYDASVPIPHAFVPQNVDRPLGQVVSEAGLRQLRIAETEKYPHVTYFFNGGEEKVFAGEERVMIPSPKVATYDLQPEMSAPGIAEEVLKWIAGDKVDMIVLNFANPDMVGHTGVLAAAIKAVETVDTCLGQVVEAVRAKNGAVLILADHGNCDQMIDYETGLPHTNHTTYPVPCILVDDTRKHVRLRDDGVLANAAPTMLELLGLPRPAEMTHESLIVG
jgi:2,3-bisphosphoglycerate-independent phosphoglycerate mutase